MRVGPSCTRAFFVLAALTGLVLRASSALTGRLRRPVEIKTVSSSGGSGFKVLGLG